MVGIIMLCLFFGFCFVYLLFSKKDPKVGEIWYTVVYSKRHPWDKEDVINKVKILDIKDHIFTTYIKYENLTKKEECKNQKEYDFIYVRDMDVFKRYFRKFVECEENKNKPCNI